MLKLSAQQLPLLEPEPFGDSSDHLQRLSSAGQSRHVRTIVSKVVSPPPFPPAAATWLLSGQRSKVTPEYETPLDQGPVTREKKTSTCVPDNSATLHAALSNNNRTVHTVPNKNSHTWSQLEKDRDRIGIYTKAKRKTSRVATRILIPPNTSISAKKNVEPSRELTI